MGIFFCLLDQYYLNYTVNWSPVKFSNSGKTKRKGEGEKRRRRLPQIVLFKRKVNNREEV